MSHWKTYDSIDGMRGTGPEEASYVAGWTISGLVTLGAIVAVWLFAV